MEVEYKKDLHHNYMVIKEKENEETELYCIKMLNYQSIEGLLSLERRTIDNQVLYYYDITAKQSLGNLFDKSALSFDRVKRLFIYIIDTIERAYEYLLSEDDFVLNPEYVYLDMTTDVPYLCYLSSYHKNIKEQMSSFIEYLMNKVDYKDKEAVLLIYRLYAASKEESFTLNYLLEVMEKQNLVSHNGKLKGLEKVPFENIMLNEIGKPKVEKEEEREAKKPKIPVMIEKLEGEEEVFYYPIMTYLLTGACAIGGILITTTALISKIIYNVYGNRIDYSKLFALLLILLCVEGYLLKKIWDKKNRITKMVTKQEYFNPSMDYEKLSVPSINLKSVKEKVLMEGKEQKEDKNQMDEKIKKGDRLHKEEMIHKGPEEDYNPTCLLNEKSYPPSLLLKSLDEVKYESITITDFPFFIGKLRKNVDYCLEKDVVSRYHAKITKEQEQYFITDLNSTNGTFLNSETLQTYQKKEIKVGDEIAIANIKFRFMLLN